MAQSLGLTNVSWNGPAACYGGAGYYVRPSVKPPDPRRAAALADLRALAGTPLPCLRVRAELLAKAIAVLS